MDWLAYDVRHAGLPRKSDVNVLEIFHLADGVRRVEDHDTRRRTDRSVYALDEGGETRLLEIRDACGRLTDVSSAETCLVIQ